MENIRLYEDFNNHVIPKESDLGIEVSKFFDVKPSERKINPSFRYEGSDFQKKYSMDKVMDLIRFLKEKNYSLEIFPYIDANKLKVLKLVSQIDFSNPMKDIEEYGITILFDCEYSYSSGQKYKACINIEPTAFSYKLLSDTIKEINLKEFSHDGIDMLFWNGKYLVTGQFENVDDYEEEGYKSLFFESSKTSDNIKYNMSVRVGFDWNDLIEIEDIDFARSYS